MWQESDWETALGLVAERLGTVIKQHGGAQIGALAAPTSTLEEFHLLARIARGLGSGNVDHRLRRTDFRDDANDPLYPALGCSIAELEQVSSALIVGSNIRKEVPLLAHRLRKAALRGAKISFVNAQRYEYLFPVAGYLASNGLDLFGHLVAIAAAASAGGKSTPESIAALVASAQPTDAHRAIAQQLGDGSRRMILLGALAQRDPAFGDLRLVAGALAELTGATLGYLPDGGNSVGACLAGVLPHRTIGGRAAQSTGLNVADMFAARLKSYILLGGIEPAFDIASPAAIEALKAADFVVALSPYGTAKEFAHVILPIGTFAETSGTYVNLEGRWQSVPGAAAPVGESRPAWKVLRVLGNLLNLSGFDYTSSDQITEEVRKQLEAAPAFALKASARTLQSKLALGAAAAQSDASRDVPIYAVDALVRRSSALQATGEARATSRGRSS
jgi:NADH-quinone oxidoreductase subunit G